MNDSKRVDIVAGIDYGFDCQSYNLVDGEPVSDSTLYKTWMREGRQIKSMYRWMYDD